MNLTEFSAWYIMFLFLPNGVCLQFNKLITDLVLEKKTQTFPICNIA